MTFTPRDLIKIQWALYIALALLIAGGMIAWWSHNEALKAGQELASAIRGKTQIEQRLQQARTEEQELKERARAFQYLQSAGITGDEKRLDWSELLSRLQHEQKLPGMNYEFGVQQSLEKTNGAGYAWFASPLHLRLRLLHEGDLLKFLSRLQREAKAQVLIRGCQLTPVSEIGENNTALPLLEADCTMQWLTLRRGSGKP